ncbi:unnamed protein product [Pieris macdunnoughi]|uniref:Gustatory receptor n=2 Tax=Pieris macdunnoughi TaxID=345717 RepID=A0A821RKI6_9NEOP|nr:unnamed protein product [Pieris macdunnoughi]
MKFETTSYKNMLNLFRPLIIIMFICGYNFKTFTPSLLRKVIAQLYSLSLVIIVSYCTMNCCNVINPSQFMSLLEYDFSVLVSMIYNSKILKFISGLKCLDGYLRINKRHYTIIKFRFFFIAVTLWIIRIIYTTLSCTSSNCFYSFFPFTLNIFSSLALDLNRVWRFTILNTIRFRIKLLRRRLEEDPEENYYLYAVKMKTVKEDKLKFCLFIYRQIGNMVDLIQPEMHAQMFVSIICGIPKLVVDIYHILLVIENHEPITALGFTVMHIIHVSFLLMSPSVVIELFQVEIEKIRLHLIHQIIDSSDPKTKEDAQIFLQYSEIRSIKSKLWRCIPINIALPLDILNICYSAIIVIINFTDLY